MYRLRLSHTNECPCGTGVQDLKHILRNCSTHTLERTRLFPTGSDYKLWRSKDELQTTAHPLKLTSKFGMTIDSWTQKKKTKNKKLFYCCAFVVAYAVCYLQLGSRTLSCWRIGHTHFPLCSLWNPGRSWSWWFHHFLAVEERIRAHSVISNANILSLLAFSGDRKSTLGYLRTAISDYSLSPAML